MSKILCVFAVALCLAFSLIPTDSTRAVGPYEDSLYIVKPESDSLAFVHALNTAFADDTIRLLNHTPDTLSVVASVVGDAFYLDSTHTSLTFSIAPDTAYQFFVRFNPLHDGADSGLIVYSQPFDTTYLSGVASDSLFIVKPGDSLEWGEKVIGAAPVVRTIRLLNHGLDTLTGAVYSTNACFALNDTMDTLAYSIPDSTGVFQFTVSFNPSYRGPVDGWLWYTDPFDSMALSGSATGGYESRARASLYSEYPFSGTGAAVNPYGQSQPGFNGGLFPVLIYGGGSMEDISAGCWRAISSDLSYTVDSTRAIVSWTTDSLCTHHLLWNFGEEISSASATVHLDTLNGLTPENTHYGFLQARSCRTLDPSCCVNSNDTTFNTTCEALSSNLNLAVSQDAHHAVATWNTRTATASNLRWKAAGGAWDTCISFAGYYTTHNKAACFTLGANTVYYISVKSVNACNETKGWSDSLAFITGADSIIGHCPTVAKSSIATKTVTASSANLTLNSSLACIMRFRYHASPSGAWAYRTEPSDSTGHTIAVAGLSGSTGYVWETKPIHSQCPDTTAVSYGDSTAFTTLTACPTVTPSGFATKAITSTGATLTFTTDIAAHAHFKYALYASSTYTHRHDADADSAGTHTVSIAGLTANYIRYKWLSYAIGASGCDSTFANQQNFYTACTLPTVSNKLACYDAGNYIEIQTAGRGVYVQFRIRTQVGPGAWTTYGYDGGGACHQQLVGTLANTTLYDLEYQIKDECGTERGWTSMGGGLTNSSGRFTETCLCGGA